MVCDTYLQKAIVKSTFLVNFCKRRNTFDNFWGTFANDSIHSTISQNRVIEKVRKKSSKKVGEKVAALLLFSAFFDVSLGSRVVEPQGP